MVSTARGLLSTKRPSATAVNAMQENYLWNFGNERPTAVPEPDAAFISAYTSTNAISSTPKASCPPVWLGWCARYWSDQEQCGVGTAGFRPLVFPPTNEVLGATPNGQRTMKICDSVVAQDHVCAHHASCASVSELRQQYA